MRVLATFALIGLLAAFSPAQTPASRSTEVKLQVTYAGRVELRAAIDRIEYSDGSYWAR